MGMRELSSAYIIAVVMATEPEMMKLINKLGPAYYAAIPVSANIPAPIVFPIPKRTRSVAVSVLCRSSELSSESKLRLLSLSFLSPGTPGLLPSFANSIRQKELHVNTIIYSSKHYLQLNWKLLLIFSFFFFTSMGFIRIILSDSCELLDVFDILDVLSTPELLSYDVFELSFPSDTAFALV